ncbi:MAG: hypothetical protein J6Y35_03450, partial [Bacteroidales bacterium]|nr:hypothetical protein [Bacteroidales bacterium]
PFITRTSVLCTSNRLKLSRNNLSFVCYISFHSLKELARFPLASPALAVAHPLPLAPSFRRAKRDCKNTPFILLRNTCRKKYSFFFLQLHINELHVETSGKSVEKHPKTAPFRGFLRPQKGLFSEFFGKITAKRVTARI